MIENRFELVAENGRIHIFKVVGANDKGVEIEWEDNGYQTTIEWTPLKVMKDEGKIRSVSNDND